MTSQYDDPSSSLDIHPNGLRSTHKQARAHNPAVKKRTHMQHALRSAGLSGATFGRTDCEPGKRACALTAPSVIGGGNYQYAGAP